MIQPETDQERAAFVLFIGWMQAVLGVAGENEARAGLARELCDGP